MTVSAKGTEVWSSPSDGYAPPCLDCLFCRGIIRFRYRRVAEEDAVHPFLFVYGRHIEVGYCRVIMLLLLWQNSQTVSEVFSSS